MHVDALGTDFDALLTRGAVGALVLAAVWAAVVVAAVAVEARTRGRVRFAERAGCPPAVRLWLIGFFVALFAGVAPAEASDAGSGSGTPGTALGTPLDGLPIPDRVTGVVIAASAARSADNADDVVVRPGDSLWRIARDRLPADADDATVAGAAAALYAANRPTIGPDPDLLRPGQHLDFPDPTTTSEAP